MTAAQWLKREEVGNPAALRLMTWIALHLGRRISRLVLLPIVLFFYCTNRAGRVASRAYLQRIPGQASHPLAVMAHLHAFASVTLDRLYFLNGRMDLFDVSINDVDNQALGTASKGAGMFLMGAHLGSFESVRSIAREYPHLKMVLVMYEENARNIKQSLAAINPQAQQQIISLGRPGAMLEVREQLQLGGIVGILADRSIDDQGTVSVPLLGSPASFPLGPFRMAALLKHPVFFMSGIYHGGNRYVVHLEMIADFSQPGGDREVQTRQSLERYVQLLQKHCEATPYNWFNFYDFWSINAK
jgi:predicted LPLAT superfamily acyltransferase